MSEVNEATTSETVNEDAASKTAEAEASQGLSQEGIAELQQRIDAIQAERDKLKTKAEQQEGRAKKAEALLKAEKAEVSEQIDQLSQQLELSKQQQESLGEQVAKLTTAQVGATVSNAILDLGSTLVKGNAAGDLAYLMSKHMGVKDGKVVVLTENGTPRLSATGKEMTAVELRDELLKTRPYFLKSKVTPGQGGASDTGGTINNVNLTELDEMSSSERAEVWRGLSDEQKKALLSQVKV